MSINFWIIVISLFLIYDIYYEKSLITNFKKYKKYYKIAIIVIFAFGTMRILNHSPNMSYQNMKSLHDFIQVMPIDRNSKDLLTPFLGSNTQHMNINEPANSLQMIQRSGGKSSKRSVSETKKKYVASIQNWKCKHCQKQLTAWFEVDHKIRLEYGGTNEVSNLEALCRECHGKKTSMENM